MAAVTITAANVVPSASAQISQVVANDTIGAGQNVYLDANNLAVKCTANGSGLTYKLAGMAANSASAGQPVGIITQDPAGTVLGSGNLVIGTVYIAGATAGALHPISDLTTGWKCSPVGVAITTSALKIFPVTSCRADVATA